MYHYRARLLLILFLGVTSFNVNGQTSAANGSNPLNGRENNPYSQYGLGELNNPNNAALRGMGDISSAWASQFMANVSNPASYSFLARKRISFEAGANATTRNIIGKISGNEQSYRTGSASVAYMNMAMQVGKKGGLAFGFRPYAQTYYKLEDTLATGASPVSPNGIAIRQYMGEGGMNYAFAGGSVQHKGLSIGFNAGYLFGTYRNSSFLFDGSQGLLNNIFISNYSAFTRVGGIHWNSGLLYELKIDSSHYLSIGATYTMSQKVTQKYKSYEIATFGFGDTTTRDTSNYTGDLKGKITLPLSFSGGIIYRKSGVWSVGVNYTTTKWSGFNSELNTQMNSNIAASSYKASVGGEYTPDATSIRKYLSRATYRLGGYYGNDYLEIKNNSIPYYGLTAGMSLPFHRTVSEMHFALDAGVLGTTENNLIKQNYFKFTIGISLGERAFIKPKYE